MIRSSSFAMAFTRVYAIYHPTIVLVFCVLIARRAPPTSELIGFAITVGLLGGAAFNVGHELIHRHTRIDDALARLLLCSVGYPTFQIEHIAHHHKWVATDRDPSSSPAGVSLYAHLPRAIVLNIRNAAAAAYRRSRSYGLRNAFVRGVVYLLAIAAGLFVGFGPRALVFFVLQSLVAIVWLEIANYFQHYGLRRALVDGRPEPIAEHHSWDVDQPQLNKIWLNLPLHSRHHLDPTVSFDALTPARTSPKYPCGYLTCTLIAIVPPLWTRFAAGLLADHRPGRHSNHEHPRANAQQDA